MKLLRLKITDPKGFRCLQAGFEHHFRTEWDMDDERDEKRGFEPFVCAGPNGSGKSNLLEALAAIFYHLECIELENRPDQFDYDEQENPGGFRAENSIPDGFEIEYLTPRPQEFPGEDETVRVLISKSSGHPPQWSLWNSTRDNWEMLENIEKNEKLAPGRMLRRALLPDYILGYSSGENEILSLPFFKMRFVQLDEYLQALRQQLPYPGRPESRLVYLDSGFSQAMLICNLLFHDTDALQPLRDDVKINELKEFRIIMRCSIEIGESQIQAFGSQDDSKRESIEKIVKNHPALTAIENETSPESYRRPMHQTWGSGNWGSGNWGSSTWGESSAKRYRLNLVQLLDDGDASDKILPRLKRCATCWYLDEASDTLCLDYHVDDATRQAFRDNFDFEINRSPIVLFQAFQVLLALNLFSASEDLKRAIYQSGSLYVSDTVPILASDERIMRFKNVWVTKTDIHEPVLMKSFSDGEHQLLHSLGLCLLFKNTRSLFLLDEPETHFNPNWRASFITRLYQSFHSSNDHEMLITTHTPFLISDSRPEKVMVFKKENEAVSVARPEYNTLGASINKITMTTFEKRETIGGHAQTMLEKLRQRFERGENKDQLLIDINRQIGDSVEKILLIKTILDSMEGQG